MIKRLALVAGAATLLAGLATGTVASGHSPQRGDGNVHVRVASGAPDQVIQWNEELQQVVIAPGAQPASIHPTRTLAITQIAVYDAVNGILGGGQPLLADRRGPRRRLRRRRCRRRGTHRPRRAASQPAAGG